MSDTIEKELARERTKSALIARGVGIAEADRIATGAKYNQAADGDVVIDIGPHRALASQPATIADLAEKVASNPEGHRIPDSSPDAGAAAARAAGKAAAVAQKRTASDTALALS